MRFLALVDLEGAVVTMDALHTRSDTAEQITDQHGVLTVKANQPSLYHALKRLPWKHVPRDSRPDQLTRAASHAHGPSGRGPGLDRLPRCPPGGQDPAHTHH